MTEQEQKVWDELIPTWQPLSAIAYRTKLPVRTCEKILIDFYNNGTVKCSRVRIDGHNKVFLFKRIQYQKILGVVVPINNENDEI